MIGRIALLTFCLCALLPAVYSKDCRRGPRCGDDHGDCCYDKMICNEGQPEYLEQCFFGIAKDYHCCTYEEEEGAAFVIFIVIPVVAIIVGSIIGCFCCWKKKYCCFEEKVPVQQPPMQGVQVVQPTQPMPQTPGFAHTASANFNAQPMQGVDGWMPSMTPAAGKNSFCTGCGAPGGAGKFCASCGKAYD